MNDIIQMDIKHRKGDTTFTYQIDIPEGITGIFGPSGAGKTTLLHLLAGTEKPEEGFISINKREVFNSEKNINLKVHHRKCGYVFQDARLFPHLTVGKNMKFGYKYLHDKPGIAHFNSIADLLELTNLLDNKPYQLSGGQKQRVAIGRALLAQPDLILLDEPFSNLDKPIRKQIISYLLKINKILDIPVIVVSHDLEDLLRLTTNIIIIKDGEISGKGNYYNLFFDVPELNSGNSLNIIEARVVDIKTEQQLICLESSDQIGNIIYIQHRYGCADFKMSDKVRVGIKPEDISISLNRVPDISIQNQWIGIIKKIRETDEGIFCLIDCGFYLLAEITSAAKYKLNLQAGKKIFCLMKSKGIEIIHKFVL